MIPILARWLAAAYPPRFRRFRHDTILFVRDLLNHASRSRGVTGVLGGLWLIAADAARAWLGRSELPLTVDAWANNPAALVAGISRRSTRMDRLAADIRYAFRVLARTPGFTLTAVVTLALGIGAATAVYAVADAVMLRPFPYRDMDRIVVITELGGNGQGMSVSWHNYRDWAAQNQSFEELGVYRGATVTLVGPERAERLSGATMSSSVFATMGLEPVRGRRFGPEHDLPGTPMVAVISERAWRTHFGAREDIVGHKALFNNQPFTIVGVMPPGMRFPSRLTDVWLPLGLSVAGFPPRGAHPGLTAVGRVKPGVTIDAARTEMSTIAARLAEQYPDSNKGNGVTVTGYYDLIVQNIRPALLMLLGAVGLLVLIACTNLASLMLARSEARQREMAVRAALGAGRRRLLRQLLIESGVLAIAGGLVGVLLAYLAVSAFVASGPTTVPRIDLVGIDWRVAAFATALSVLTVVLFGLLPALRGSRPNLQNTLGDLRSVGHRRSVRLRRLLVASQVAVAVVMLIGAGLLAKTLTGLMSIELGFEPDRVITMRLALPDASYPTPASWIQFHRALLERVSATPGVEAIGLNSAVPLEGGGAESPVMKEGDPPPSRDQQPTMCLFQATGGDYFKAMGIQLLQGRVFDARDVEGGAPVAVVDESLAQKLFGGENPVGRRIAFEFDGHDVATFKPLWREVVGVVRHVKHYGLTGEPPYVQIYAPFVQLPFWMQARRPAMALIARAQGAPETVVNGIRQAVSGLDARIPVYGVQPLRALVGQTTEQSRLSAALVIGFAGVALVLAAVGLYGVLSYLVSQRTREIGLRLALGAARGHIVRQIVGQGLGIALIGLAVGLAGAFAGTRLLDAMLFNVSPTDISTFAAVATVLSLVAVVASALPARRASSVDPLKALRSD